MCTVQTEQKIITNDSDAKATTKPARAFLKERFHMSDQTAADLCIAGESAIIARDKVHRWEFCLKPKDDTFDLIYSGAMAAVPCNGTLGNEIMFGDRVNVCRGSNE